MKAMSAEHRLIVGACGKTAIDCDYSNLDDLCNSCQLFDGMFPDEDMTEEDDCGE